MRAIIKAHLYVCLEKTADRAHERLLQREEFARIDGLVDLMVFDRLAREPPIGAYDIEDDGSLNRGRALNALQKDGYPTIVRELLLEIVAELSL